MNSPTKTFFLGLALVLLFGLARSDIVPHIFNDMYSAVSHQPPKNPFLGTQTIYSNFIPLEHDIIDLDKSGTLIPSPYNFPFGLTPQGLCTTTGKPLVDYSQGIVLILNAAPTLSSRSNGRGMSFHPPLASNYFTFQSGTTKNIETSDGRVFLVTLSYINDLSTEKNGSYFSYVFNINEK